MKEIKYEECQEEKSLRWLANMFPLTLPAKDETDRMSNAIHVYSEAGAKKIKELQEKLSERRDTTVMTDGVTECCGYDFGLDGFGKIVKYCPLCGKRIVKQK